MRVQCGLFPPHNIPIMPTFKTAIKYFSYASARALAKSVNNAIYRQEIIKNYLVLWEPPEIRRAKNYLAPFYERLSWSSSLLDFIFRTTMSLYLYFRFFRLCRKQINKFRTRTAISQRFYTSFIQILAEKFRNFYEWKKAPHCRCPKLGYSKY